MKQKSLRVLVFILLIGSLVLASCAGQTAPEEPVVAPPAGVAEEFDWKSQSGASLNLLMVKHPFAETMEARMEQFTADTGITVSIDYIPEETYFDKLTTLSAGRSKEYDAFMIGSYMIWQYAPAGYLEPLDSFLENPALTTPDYDFEDFVPITITDQRWTLVDGEPTGQGSLYALPWGFHTSNLIYRKSILEDCGVDVPTNLEELYEVGLVLKECRPDMIPLVTRGTRSWATIHPSVMSWYTSYGGKDVVRDDSGSLVCALDQTPEAVEAHELWGNIIREVAQPNYSDYTWYDVANSFTQGNAVMFYDADIIGYFFREGSEFPDDWGLAPPPGKPGGDPTANEWIWSISMNAYSENKEAAWIWMQYTTTKDFILDAAVNGLTVDPVRRSAWESQAWIDKIEPFTGYWETFQEIEPFLRVYYTPQAAFIEVATEWSVALQEIHSGRSAQEALSDACSRINASLD